MLKKTRSTETGTVKVTFLLPTHTHANHVHVVGDFNDWQGSTPMKHQKDGSWRANVDLAPGRDYQFRYLVDGNHWVNDEAADAYVPNPFGADNSLLRTPHMESAASGSAGGKSVKAAAKSKANGRGADARTGKKDGKKGKDAGGSRAKKKT